MSDISAILHKRRCWPVTICGGTVHVRALTNAEKDGLIPLSASEASWGVIIGCGLLHEDESQVFTREPEESWEAFGDRVLLDDLLQNMPTDTQAELSQTISKLSQGPSKEQLKAIEKN